MKEVYKTIVNFENYQISNYGNVKSCERFAKTVYGFRKIKQRILKAGVYYSGYFYFLIIIKKTTVFQISNYYLLVKIQLSFKKQKRKHQSILEFLGTKIGINGDQK